MLVLVGGGVDEGMEGFFGHFTDPRTPPISLQAINVPDLDGVHLVVKLFVMN